MGEYAPSAPALLAALPAAVADRCPTAVAFHCDGVDVTCEEFADLCRRTAGWLETQGIRGGDRVAVWLPNSVDWLALLFAVAHVGATLVSVNTRFRSEEVGRLLERTRPKLLVMQERLGRIDFGEILRGVERPSVAALLGIAILGGSDPATEERFGVPVVPFDPTAPSSTASLGEPDAPVILFTTSGTTRGPKFVVHTQRTLGAHARDVAAAYGLDRQGAALLAALPFCGVFGLNAVLAAFAAGAPVTILRSFDGQAAADAVTERGLTHAFGSDEMFRKLIDAAPTERPFPSARLFGFGAFTSSFTDYARDACRRGLPLVGLYGSSEILALFSAQSLSMPLEERLRGGGVPVAAEARVRVRDVETGELVRAGGRGEIEISAPSLFAGYLDDPVATREALRDDGFFRTGDLGCLRDDGSFVFEARMGDAMRLGGFLVDPVEIEAVLKRIAGIADAQVVAVPIDRQIRAVAFVVQKAGHALRGDELIREAAATMAPFKVPARVWFVERYPTTESSNGLKTQRNKLREWASDFLLRERARA